MAYIESDYINVYPSASRGVNIPKARLLSEKAIVRIINTLIDKPGFVIGEEIRGEGNASTTWVKFNLGGYYFEIDKSKLSQNGDVYASLNWNESSSEDFKEINGDSEGSFTGLEIADSGTLLILSNGSIPDESKIKFESRSIPVADFDVIDGGIIS